MLVAVVALLGVSQAAVVVGASIGGTGSAGLRTGLPVYGPDGGLWADWGGEKHGLQVEVRDYALTRGAGWWNLPGLHLSWRARLGDGVKGRPYTTLGAGAYRNDVVIALPIVSGECGYEGGALDGWLWRVGAQAIWVPPGFAAGGGLRLSIGRAL